MIPEHEEAERGYWVDCPDCDEGLSYHDCGEDVCCCADPMPNVRCDKCDGAGGWMEVF